MTKMVVVLAKSRWTFKIVNSPSQRMHRCCNFSVKKHKNFVSVKTLLLKMQFKQFRPGPRFGCAVAEPTESMKISVVKLLTWNQRDPNDFPR